VLRLPYRRFGIYYICACDSSGYGHVRDVTRRLVWQKFTDVSEEKQSNAIVNEFSTQRVPSSNIGLFTGKFIYIFLWFSFVWPNEY
jgi:hypothetical protein